MILVLVSNYKTKDNPYVNGFVHSRVKSYLRQGIPTKVVVLDFKKKNEDYTIEDVDVLICNIKRFTELIKTYDVKTVCIHFINPTMIAALNNVTRKLNLLIFVHGVEALKWYQRLFPGIFSSVRQTAAFVKYIHENVRSLKAIKKFLTTTPHNCTFVTVSNWMKEAAVNAWSCKGVFTWHIIPNIIDSEIFPFRVKNDKKRLRLLSIRPFDTGKYANDITANVIQELAKVPCFPNLTITWIGDGRLYDKTIKNVVKYSNVHFEKRLLPQIEIPKYHNENGVFLCPTRQDAQGVSMCEAMSSGLVPITLYNTAIPEFLPDDQRLVCHNAEDMVKLILYLVDNPLEYQNLSQKCSKFVQDKCGYLQTTSKELELIKKLEFF